MNSSPADAATRLLHERLHHKLDSSECRACVELLDKNGLLAPEQEPEVEPNTWEKGHMAMTKNSEAIEQFDYRGYRLIRMSKDQEKWVIKALWSALRR